jgi:uncharacterized protein YjbI with pentapeptide repeats
VVLLLILIILAILAGLILWLPLWSDRKERGALGASLVTGAVISLAFFFLQDQHEKHEKVVADRQAKLEHAIADQQTKKQKEISDQQALRITVSLQRNLAGTDLSGKDLRTIDLGGKNLSGADLRGAQLERVRLVAANLEHAQLEDADLHRADLTEANLQGATLNGANFTKTQLVRAHLNDAMIGQVSGGKPADLAGAQLINADLRRACLASVNLKGAHLSGADFTGAVLTNADLRDAELELDGVPVNLKGAWAAGVHIDPTSRGLTTKPKAPKQKHQHHRHVVPRPPSDTVIDHVASIADGDTIRLLRLGWVRLIGINAPSRNDPVGASARDFLTQTLPKNSVVRYQLGPQRRESVPRDVGRWRAYIWLDNGQLLNAMILRRGYAQRQINPPEAHRYTLELKSAEKIAKATGRGVWRTCHKQ